MVQIGRYATCETPKRLWPSFRTEAVEVFRWKDLKLVFDSIQSQPIVV